MVDFVSCTDPQSTCTNPLYSFQGAVGVCNNVTGLCLCPDGYFGVDLLAEWNDCHIGKAARTATESLALIASSIGLIMVVYGIYSLLSSWGARPTCVRGMLWLKFPTPEPSEVSYQRQYLERRKRRIFMAIFANLFSFSVISIAFQIMTLASPTFSVLQRPNGFGLFLISTDISSIVVALWMVLFAWFDTLPSFRLFSKMFPQIRNSVLVQHPSFILFAVLINCFLTCTLSFGVLFVFSLVRPDKITTVVVPWGLTVFGIELAVFVIILMAVCVLLLRLLNVFSDESSGKTSPGRSGALSPEARARFTEAKHTIWAMFILTIVCGPVSIALCMIMAWYPFARANFFFFVALFQAAGAVVALFTVFVFVFRMHYGVKKPAETTALLSRGIEPGSGDISISLGGDIHSPNPKFSFLGQEKAGPSTIPE